MDKIPIDILPAIVHVIEKAQETLKGITGLNIKLQVLIVEESVNHREVLWISLQHAICTITDSSWGSISGGSRYGNLPLYKKLYCYFGKKYIGGKSLKMIAQDVGMMNHTSALTAANDFKEIINDPTRKEHDLAVSLYSKLKQRLNIS